MKAKLSKCPRYLHASGRGLRIEAASSAANCSRVVSECPILPATGNLSRLRVNGHHAATRERTNVWPSMLVKRQVPRGDGAAPVAKHLAERSGPLAPIGQIRGVRIIRPTFGPMHLNLGIGILDLAHHVRAAIIAMPRNRIDILPKLPIPQRAYGSPPQIVVMVQHPNLYWHPIALQKWAQMVADEFNLVFLRPDARRHLAILIRVNFILRG